jgi:tetratricopeptide (TPR) repeat protein
MLGLAALLFACISSRNGRGATKQTPPALHATWQFSMASLLFVAAMLSKPSAVMLPGLLLIIDRFIFARPWRWVLCRAGLWILLAIPVVIIAKLVQPGHDAGTVAPPQRMLVAGDALAFYLWKLIWPLNLAFDYGRTPKYVISQSWIWLTALAPLVVAAAAVAVRKRQRVFAIALAIFAVALIPVLGLAPFDFQIYSTVGDHYLYLAMLGPAILITWLARRRHAAIIICAVIAIFSILSARQVWTWRDLETVAAQSIRVTPTSWASHNNLSSALSRKGKVDQAIAAARRAVELRPDLRGPRESLAGALVLRGDAHADIGNRDAAIAAYRQAIEALPDSALAWTNLAATYAEGGDYDRAIEAYEKAIQFDPKSEQARAGLEMARKLKAQVS